jgi:pilus assembly protein CpaD
MHSESRLRCRRSRGAAVTGIALLVLAAAASGCASYSSDHVIVGSVPDDYRTRHPIVVAQSETWEDIVVPVNANRLSNRDIDIVKQLAVRYRRAGATGMAVMIPSGSRNEAAARRLAHHAALVLKENGVAVSDIQAYHFQAGGQATPPLRLVYGSLAAQVTSACGQWNEDIAETSENRNYYNFGCATQFNLAAMLANPADILGPRAETEIDSTRRDTVITIWREDGTGDLPPLF